MTDLTQLDHGGNFKEAIEKLKATPTYDSSYFYNLGVLHGKSGSHGLAFAYLEKANQLKPHDPEIQRNLKIARTALDAHLANIGAGIGVDSVSTPLELFSDRIQVDEIYGIIGLITLLVSLLWIRAYLKTRNLLKTLLKPSGWFGVFGLVLVFALYGLYRSGNANPPAVLITRDLLRSGPGLSFPEIAPIEPGVTVRLVGSPSSVNENENWQKVRYKGQEMAWLPVSSLLPL
jgi:hypothetical protein